MNRNIPINNFNINKQDLDIAKPGQFIVYTGDLLQVDARGYEQQVRFCEYTY